MVPLKLGAQQRHHNDTALLHISSQETVPHEEATTITDFRNIFLAVTQDFNENTQERVSGHHSTLT